MCVGTRCEVVQRQAGRFRQFLQHEQLRAGDPDRFSAARDDSCSVLDDAAHGVEHRPGLVGAAN